MENDKINFSFTRNNLKDLVQTMVISFFAMFLFGGSCFLSYNYYVGNEYTLIRTLLLISFTLFAGSTSTFGMYIVFHIMEISKSIETREE